MKKIPFLLFILFTVIFTSSAQTQLIVDPNAQVRALDRSFSKIKVSNGIDVFLSQSDTESLAVSAAEKKYADRIVTVIEGGQLRISYDHNGNWNIGDKNLKVYISFKELSELNASGSSNIKIAGTLNSDKLLLRLSGSSDFSGNVKSRELVIDLSGSSDVKISGSASVLNLENSGASDFDGYDLAVDVCTTKSSGASDVNITVNKEINVQASGASDVYYRGNPVVKSLRSSGSSTVARSKL